MKPHNWIIEEVNAGFDIGYFWVCRQCGCSGGPTGGPLGGETSFGSGKPGGYLNIGYFLAGVGLTNLPEDCDEAKDAIDKYVYKYPDFQQDVARARGLQAHVTPPKSFRQRVKFWHDSMPDEASWYEWRKSKVIYNDEVWREFIAARDNYWRAYEALTRECVDEPLTDDEIALIKAEVAAQGSEGTIFLADVLGDQKD